MYPVPALAPGPAPRCPPHSVSPLLAQGVDPEATEIYVICLSAHR